MKVIRLVISLLLTCSISGLFAQTVKNYDDQWKRVDDLIQKRNLPKSALEEVKKIYELAKRDKQDAQILKALVYMSTLQNENRDDNQKIAIKEFEKELPLQKDPVVSILKSLLATKYWEYFQNYRWQIYNRTNTTEFNKEDIATWTIEDFHRKISELYLQSIQNAKLLQQTKLAPFDAIIVKGNVRHLRPTLYDLLAQKALDYFKTGERDIKKPAYAFSIDDPKAFAPAADFVKYKFSAKDSLSLQYKALTVYQDLISFHLRDANPDALIDVDIDRIEFVHQNATLENKDDLYIDALDAMTERFGKNPAAAQAWYLIAAHYNNLASQYQPLGDTTYRFEKLKAKELLERVVRDSAVKSEGWVNSFNLLNQLTAKEYSFELEKVNVPGKPFRSLIRYRNTANLNFRIVAATEELKNLLQHNREKYWNALRGATAIRSWQQTLPATNDLQNHSVEIKVDGLPVGEYFLMASPEANFMVGTLAAQMFYVSNISYVGQGDKFFVLHRETGHPLANASVEVFTQEYNYNTSRTQKVKRADYKTDKNGFFTVALAPKENQRAYLLNINYDGDKLFLNDNFYNYYYEGQKEDNINVQRILYFTDRSLYRPGQVVYFKGIVFRSDKRENKISVGYKTIIYLRNANYEVVDSLQVTINEFGSFSGRFTLPQNVLNGNFSISENNGGDITNFSVEEYKRPKFYVSFDKVKNTYKAGDIVTVAGSAKAYAGNNIDGATVNYRVVRQPRFIYYGFWRIFPPQAAPMEIAHGTTTTDKDGKFSIRFTAIPDKKLDKRYDPVFDYQIYADVTDVAGETRSAENTISAGYKSLLLRVALPERIATNSLKNISVRTENMNGEFQQSTVTVTFSNLLPEQRLVRKRYWQQPDQFVMSKEEFLHYFPNDEYRNETDYKTWSVGKTVYSKTDTTSAGSVFNVADAKLAPGFYLVEVTTTDKDGQPLKDVGYVEIYDEHSNKLSRPEYLWTKGSTPIEPGEKTSVIIGSASPDVFVIRRIDKNSGKKTNDDIQIVRLDSEKKRFDFGATENDRGGYGVGFLFVKDNRVYQFNDIIRVPWTNKDLSIEYATFRDKTLPGSEEKWTVKISGYKNEKVAAEMLASMYDGSLDQFKPHNWSKPQIWPIYTNLFAWQSFQNFSAQRSVGNYRGEHFRSFNKQYDRFIFDNFHGGAFVGYGTVRRDMMLNEVASQSAPAAPVRIRGNNVEAVKDMSQELTSTTDTTQQQLGVPPVADEGLIQIRKNFNETAFFFPELRTDKNGSIEFSFTTPEALTRWKLQTFAHTKDLATGVAQKEIITQKELMVQPNAPRFLRQGDHIELSTKVANLSEKELSGRISLQLFDAATNNPVDANFGNINAAQNFSVAAGESKAVSFPITVPKNFTSVLTWRFVAATGTLSDGEEMTLPVLSNKLLVTETMPLPMRGTGTNNFSFEKLLQSGGSTTLQQHSLTVEYTSNPAWYAVQALPYLMEQPNDNVEQTWNRYYANSLAAHIVSAAPRIRQIFERWKTVDTSALLSSLQKNQDLKSALLEETPWVLQAKTESEQKKNIALLFDLVRMNNELTTALQKVKEFQSANGGFVWLKGAPDDRYMTQYIITSIGHLRRLNAISDEHIKEINEILRTAIPYLDRKIKEDYENLKKRKQDLSNLTPGYVQIQYLYMRSFFPEVSIPQASQAAYNYFRQQSFKTWMKQNKYMQAMIALALHRTKDLQTPIDILRSLKETAIVNEETGMHWQDQRFGYSWFWWYAPIETQALIIEAFSEITNDSKTVDDLKTWLIKNKQTTNWKTTKATAEAVYAFLFRGTDWLTNEPAVQIKLGPVSFTSESGAEAGTGYFKETINGNQVTAAMGNITVSVQQPTTGGQLPTSSPSWGAVYWQYFEDMDKLTTATTPLQLTKKLFVEKNTDRGPVISPITGSSSLRIGDKIKVRIELRVDRDMEYVHMKDLRASSFEPVNVLSRYKWQDGLGYYETTKDVSTSFYFPYLRKGTYVFEYPMFVTHAGDFSNGITTIQCFYAPEFSAHSEGIRVKVQ